MLFLFVFIIGSFSFGLLALSNKRECNERVDKEQDVKKEKISVIEFVDGGWGFELGENIDELINTLGEPKKNQKNEYDNPYYEQNDMIYTLDYTGLQINIAQLSQEAGGGDVVNLNSNIIK